MKKNKLLGLAAIAISSFGLIAGVNADSVDCNSTHQAMIGEVCYDTLDSALKAVTSGETILVTESISSTTAITINKSFDITIDLGNNTIKFPSDASTRIGIDVNSTTTLKNGSVVYETTQDNPTAILVRNGASLDLKNVKVEAKKGTGINLYESNGTLNVDDKSVVTAYDNAAIIAWGSKETENKYTLNLYGTAENLGQEKAYAAINGAYEGSNLTFDINIKPGAKATSIKGAGILQMSKGKVIVEGTVIGGCASIAMTRGDLSLMPGGYVESTKEGDTDEYKGTSNFQVFSNGAAIYLEPTDQNMKVNITGGTVKSSHGAALSAPANNGKNSNLTLNIEDGSFEGVAEKGDIDVYGIAKSGQGFIQGGNFANKVAAKYLAAGKEQSESGEVGTLYTIEKEPTENGEFTVNKNAVKGETVKVIVTPNAGYQLDKITVTKEEESITVNADNTFVMPDGAVTVKVTFKLIPSKPAEDKNDIVVEEPKGDENVTLSTEASEVLKDSLLNTEDEELKEILESNENVTIVLETEKITKESLSKEELEKFESIIENAKISEFFDLSIVVKAVGQADHYLTKLNKAITLSVALPELPEVAKGYARKYYILREHDGVVEKLNATVSEDGKSLIFASDKFSKYAIAYVDEEEKDTVVDSNPSTIDGVISYITLAITSVGVLGIASKKIIKR